MTDTPSTFTVLLYHFIGTNTIRFRAKFFDNYENFKLLIVATNIKIDEFALAHKREKPIKLRNRSLLFSIEL